MAAGARAAGTRLWPSPLAARRGILANLCQANSKYLELCLRLPWAGRSPESNGVPTRVHTHIPARHPLHNPATWPYWVQARPLFCIQYSHAVARKRVGGNPVVPHNPPPGQGRARPPWQCAAGGTAGGAPRDLGLESLDSGGCPASGSRLARISTRPQPGFGEEIQQSPLPLTHTQTGPPHRARASSSSLKPEHRHGGQNPLRSPAGRREPERRLLRAAHSHTAQRECGETKKGTGERGRLRTSHSQLGLSCAPLGGSPPAPPQPEKGRRPPPRLAPPLCRMASSQGV